MPESELLMEEYILRRRWPAPLVPLGLLLCQVLGHPRLRPVALPVGVSVVVICRRCLRWRGFALEASYSSTEGVRSP